MIYEITMYLAKATLYTDLLEQKILQCILVLSYYKIALLLECINNLIEKIKIYECDRI